MILSQTAVYALKAVMHLAEAGTTEPVRVDDIAAALDVPRNYLSKILNGLVRSGVLHSTRGPGGGFTMAVDPAVVPLADVIQPFDDVAHDATCLLGPALCSDGAPCPAHARWAAVSESVKGFLLQTTIEDLTISGAHARAVHTQEGGP